MMRIVYLASGAGEMYCGSCLQSNTLAAALRAAGQDALLVPAYTPLKTDEPNVSAGRTVFGGLNVYLQDRMALFRHTPWAVDWLLDRTVLLRWLGRWGSATRAESLGAMTVSMLEGESGRQRKELEKLLAWLAREVRPDVVHLSNVLLVGMAREITRRLDVPVVSTLSGEDVFLEKLPEPHYSAARAALRERSAVLAGLVAMNAYYADFMAEYLEVDRGRIDVVRPGLNLEGHGQIPPRTRGPGDPVTIGYLARVCPDKGLHVLAEAFELLTQDADLPPVTLAAAGYLARADADYLGGIRARLAERGLGGRFEYRGELDRAGKVAFLQSLDVMSVPAVYRESKGISILEAWANGVPVVLPDHGTYPELIADTGGGLLCRPEDPHSLAEKLRELIVDPAHGDTCGRCGRQAVHERYTAERMARETIEVYERVRKRCPTSPT